MRYKMDSQIMTRDQGSVELALYVYMGMSMPSLLIESIMEYKKKKKNSSVDVGWLKYLMINLIEHSPIQLVIF